MVNRYYKKKKIVVGGLLIPPSNLVLRSRTNYVPPASFILSGGKYFNSSYTSLKGGAMGYRSNLLNNSLKRGSQLARGYY